MSGAFGKCLLNVPKIQLLEEEQAARSIVVSNISPQTTKEGVVIHFQRQKNGGGEIDHIHIPKKGTAVITFDRKEVVETALQHSHTLEGSTLKLHRLIPDYSPEVLQRVEARINLDRFQLSSQDWGKALEVLKDKTEVQYRHISNKESVLYGTFIQIFTAQTFLQDILHRRSSVLQQSKGANDAIHQVDTTQTQQNSSEMRDSDNFNVNSFEVQPQFMKFLKQVYKNKLQDIEEKHGVEIVWSENASQVQIRASEISNNPHSYQKGCDAFIDLYQNLYPNMSREVVDLTSADDRALIIEAIKTVESENQVIIEMTDNKLLVFAEKKNITSSVQALKEKLGSLQGGSGKTRRSQRNTNLGVQEHENFQEDRFSALKQLLSHGVKFSLYQSDITDERVDAIVNAANDGLQHAGGVAAAIVRKGGRQIEEESRRIMSDRRWRSLNVGDAVYTTGGDLSCQFVIHTVGPRWNARERGSCISLLRRACVESLRLAAKLELCSIALPAISSGIFGMPKSICAQVMFDAIEGFSSSIDAEFSTLRDVRIVIIDDQTISVFREEFVKRYTSQETSSTTLPHQKRRPRPSSEEQEVSSALNVTVKHPSFSSSKDLSDKQSKKSGEDNDSVESPNEGADPNVESNEPSEQMPDANKDNPPNGKEETNVETDVHDSNSDSVVSSNEGVVANVESNDQREEMPVSIKEGFPSNNYDIPNTSKGNNERTNVETEVHGSNMEKGLSGSTLVKRSNKSGKDSDSVESSIEQDGHNVENNKHRKETAVSIKEGLPSENNNFPSASKDNPPNGNEKSNVETEAHGFNMEKGINGSPLVKRSKLSNVATAARPSSGRGRGILAANFYGRLKEEAGSESNGSTQLAKTRETKSANVRKGRGITYATNNSPPGLTVTEEGKRLAQNLGKGVKGDQNTDPTESMREKEESERNESSNGAFKKENQETKDYDQNIDDNKLNGVPGNRLPPKDRITHPEEAKKGTCEKTITDRGKKLPTDENTNNLSGPNQLENKPDTGIKVDQSSSNATNDGVSNPKEPSPSNHPETSPATDNLTATASNESVNVPEVVEERRAAYGGRKRPTDENTNNLARPNQPEDKPETGIQVDHSSSNATNGGASYPDKPSPPNHSETSPATENLTPTASHESVNVRDMVGERRAAHSDAGSKPLYEMQTGDVKCSMCMNLNKDPVCPVKCGHYFCKSCMGCFIEKTIACPVCKKENVFRGNQPLGYMTWRTESYNSLPGYEEFGTIVLTFNFDKGIQGSQHPNPGEPYCGLFCTSYLPNNPAGQQLCSLLRSAFDARMIFTIGKCPATGEENNIVWNGIELKTSRSGGPANCGYPDPSYLDRAKSQLAEKGITQQFD